MSHADPGLNQHPRLTLHTFLHDREQLVRKTKFKICKKDDRGIARETGLGIRECCTCVLGNAAHLWKDEVAEAITI